MTAGSFLALCACGSPTSSRPVATTGRDPATELGSATVRARSTSASATAPQETVAELEPPPREAAAGLPTVDLLQSVATDIAVSSVYRNQVQQVAQLVDGNVETAWNSRTDDLVGAWIDVRLPANVTVTSIALTVGFTRRADSGDLFTGNHRITRVRVLREGTTVGVFPLDPESRELQTLPVTGPGGVYRIEVAEVRPGTRPNWRELCVSELRVMGRAPDARVNERLPRVAVGQLPEPRSAPGSRSREEVTKAHRAQLAWIRTAWSHLEHDVNGADMDTGEPQGTAEDRASFAQQRRAILERTADFVGLVDDVQSDRLRRAAATDVDWSSWRERGAALLADVAALAAAFATVTDWLGDDESRCQWAQTHARLRFVRIHFRAKAAEMFGLMDDSANTDQYAFVRDLMERMQLTSAVVAQRLRRRTMPDGLGAQSDWDAMRAQIDAAEASCGWGGTPAPAAGAAQP
jgi:hypothetical protein